MNNQDWQGYFIAYVQRALLGYKDVTEATVTELAGQWASDAATAQAETYGEDAALWQTPDAAASSAVQTYYQSDDEITARMPLPPFPAPHWIPGDEVPDVDAAPDTDDGDETH